MAANLDQLAADGTQRLVIRPQKSRVIAFSVAIGTTFPIGAGVLLAMGSLSAALVCLGIGGLFVYVDRLQIVFVGRSRRACAFVRKDGHTAFRVSANLYGAIQLKALARSLRVPYYDMFSGSSIDIQPGP